MVGSGRGRVECCRVRLSRDGVWLSEVESG